MKVVNVTHVVIYQIIFTLFTKRKEMLGAQLNTIHNLCFYLDLMKKIRSSIQENSFNTLHETFKLNYSNHDKI